MINKVAMYSSGILFDKAKQTGGIKRFIELSTSVCRHYPQSVLYSLDKIENQDVIGDVNFKMLKAAKKGFTFLPPEARIILSNRKTINGIKEDNYDCTVIFDVPSAIGPILLGLKNVVLMIRKDMIGYERISNNSKYLWLKLMYQWICEAICLTKSKLIICQCKYDKDILKNRHPLLKNIIERKTAIQINNVNPSWIINKSKLTKSLEKDDSNKRFRVCFIGGFDDPRKGQDLFLSSAIEILQIRSDIHFILVGGGRLLDNYKSKYLHDNINFIGRHENPIMILNTCDLLIVPSYADSCPNTVMEALFNEIPVIGSKAGGIPEILSNEDSLFEFNKTSLVKKILLLRDNPNALENLKKYQIKRKQELTFDWSASIINIIEKNII